MRHLCFVFALLLCLFANAQVTITSADMPVVGDTFYLMRDQAPAGFSIGQAGANRTWDFSNLSPDELDTTFAVDRTATPYAADFPNANLVLTNDFNFYLFYQNTSSALKAEGFANNDPSLGLVAVNFNTPLPEQYRFPATYPGNFSGNSNFTETRQFSQLPPAIQAQINAALGNCPNPSATVQQVRVTFTSSYKDTIDAWGTVITPIGTYDALRRKRLENSSTKIEVYTNCITFITFQWLEISNTPSNTTEHSWLSKITKVPLISLGYDTLRNITSVTYSATSPPPVAGFTWSNLFDGVVHFTNTSVNANRFYWYWGTGDSSATNNPDFDYTYSANGIYYVCLRALNDQIGSYDIFCDSVYVTRIGVNHKPVAVRDSAHIFYPDTAHFSLLANDTDPNGNYISFGLVFSPLNGTVVDLGGGMVNYIPNTNFSGIDSFNYTVCDNGFPIMCDTGTAVVRVDTLNTGGIASFQNEGIRILPNPANTEVKIVIGNWNAQKVEVTDINGRTLISQHSIFNAEEIIIDVSTLPQGFYICKLIGTDGNVLAGKLLKQ